MNKPLTGRPRLSTCGKAIRKPITILPEDLAYLLAINPNVSKAVRQIIKERKEQHDHV